MADVTLCDLGHFFDQTYDMSVKQLFSIIIYQFRFFFSQTVVGHKCLFGTVLARANSSLKIDNLVQTSPPILIIILFLESIIGSVSAKLLRT